MLKIPDIHFSKIHVTPSQIASALSVVITACAGIAGVARQISPAHAAEISIACNMVSALCRSLMGGVANVPPAPAQPQTPGTLGLPKLADIPAPPASAIAAATGNQGVLP